MRSTALLATMLSLAAPSTSTGSTPTTVAELDPTKYQGRWYQMYADLFVTSTFERNGVCVTADYALETDCTLSSGEVKDSCIGITNIQRDTTVDGDASSVTGKAYIPDASQPGQLNVKFDAPVPSFVDATYWVIALGELTSDGFYSYSVVTDNHGQSLFVLARDVAEFKAKYDDEVQEILAANGFKGFLYGPRETLQDGCTYEQAADTATLPPPPAALVRAAAADDECVKQYKIEDGQCGEVCLSSTIAPFARQFGGVTDGTCSSVGYTVYDHTESVSVGPFGDFDTDIYTKPSASESSGFVSASAYCPSSGSMVHAGCDMTYSFTDSCATVAAEIEARINGQYAEWHDPHNNGTYTLGSSSADLLAISRTTGDKKYTDKMNFELTETSAGGCDVNACSESQVFSISDFGTNHCNLFMLVCNSADGCSSLTTDLTYTESVNTCTDAKSACVLV